MIVTFCVFVVSAVIFVSMAWWAIRHFGGAPMTDAEQHIESTQGRMRPQVFESGSNYLPPWLKPKQ